MPSMRQTSFSAGELSPLLYGRTDLELFSHGTRKLLNFCVTPQGSAVTRPGTIHLLAAVKPETVLVPFIFSDTLAYVLEISPGFLRVHHPTNGYTGIQLAAYWAAGDLPTLQWAQVGLYLTLTHPSYAPMTLYGSETGTWYLRESRFTPPGGTGDSDLGTMQPSFRDASGNYRQPPMLSYRGGTITSLFVTDATHPAVEWRYKVSSIVRNTTTGEEVETLPVDVTQYFNGLNPTSVLTLPADGLLVLYKEQPVRLSHPLFAPPSGIIYHYPGWEPVQSVFYRGRGTLFGYIGSSLKAQDFVDVGVDPDYARQPLRGSNPFGAPGYLHPSSVAFFQQRRVFGAGASVWASATDDWYNQDLAFPPKIPEDSAIEATMVANTRQSIRSFVTHRRLLVFTDAGVWSLGGGDLALTPASIEYRLEDGVGATKLQPLVVDGAVLYVRAKGRGVRALSLEEGGNYSAQDITWQAEHLFRGPESELVSWCFQRDPWSTIWAVRADGTLLSCVRTGQTRWAWASHSMAGGKVLSVACVPAGRTDRVVLAVLRGGVTYLETLFDRSSDFQPPLLAGVTQPHDVPVALDCASAADLAVGATGVVTGLGRFEGRDVWLVAPGNPPQGPLTVTGGQVTAGPFMVANINTGGVAFLVGAAFSADLELLDAVGAGRLAQKTVVSVGFEVDSAQGMEVGEDFEHLAPWQQRTVADDYEFPSAASVLAVVAVKGAWRRTGRAVLRQAQPLPVTVLGVTRLLDVGGD